MYQPPLLTCNYGRDTPLLPAPKAYRTRATLLLRFLRATARALRPRKKSDACRSRLAATRFPNDRPANTPTTPEELSLRRFPACDREGGDKGFDGVALCRS